MTNKYGLNLDAAWRQVLREASASDIADVFRLEDYKLAWKHIRGALEAELDAGTYRPGQPQVIEVPKDGLAVRPFASIDPRDRVIYEAAVASIAPLIDAALPDEVMSARLDPKGRRTTNQIDAWVAFQSAGRHLHLDDDLGFMLSTDIASYFEYVEIEILLKDLRALPGVPGDLVSLLGLILNEFVRQSDIWGLPQGPEASAILGNFYLLPVDRELGQHPVRFIRYQDDIKVLSDSKTPLRVALQAVIRVLRSRHLNVSVLKTKFLEGPEILAEFEDARKDAIQYGIEIGSPGIASELRALFDDAVTASPIKARDVRFAIYRLAKLGDDHAVPWILDHLPEVPYLAALLVDHLSLNMVNHPEIEERTRAYLIDTDENIYPWVEFNLIRMLARAQAIGTETLRVVWAILRDQNKDSLVRQHAARCIGRHAHPGDLALLRQQFVSATDIGMRRALLLAITEADSGGPDKSFLGAQAAANPGLAHTCAYLRSGARLPEP